MSFEYVTVAGAGVLGSQIAFQCAYHGHLVCLYDLSEAALAQARNHFAELQQAYKRDLGASAEAVGAAFARISYADDLAQAVVAADLVIEAIPEVLAIKQAFYTQLGPLAPVHTVFATNSSTLLPSQMAAMTGRPAQFLALHFANTIWINNTAEIMGHATTDPAVFQQVVDFAKTIGMVALPLQKEQPGYILNTLLVPFLNAGMGLLRDGVSDVPTIDKTWMIATGAPMGPFAILDVVGVKTAYNIAFGRAQATGDPASGALAEYLKVNYIDQGKLGVATGEGFYRYPHPEYQDPDFLK
ncbi:MAG: 3-hydroxyacyl-CoA dehydrogenase [Neisseriaceae bacterium]|nr:3-hydroxyacyl-CoA dehydrogenase [Neisseriaceae bacterium]